MLLEVTLETMSVEGAVTATQTGITALKTGIDYAVTDHGGVQMTAPTCQWHLKANDLDSGTVISRGDRVIDDSDTWIVLDAKLLSWETRWELNCQRSESLTA